MLLREKKKKTLKVWEVHSLVHPLLMEGAGQWTRCGTTECMDEMFLDLRLACWDQRQRPSVAPYFSCFTIWIFAFCGWRHCHISWFGNSCLCRPTRNIIQVSLTTECEQHEHMSAHVGQGFLWSVFSYTKQSLKKEIKNGFVRDTQDTCRSMTDRSFNQPLS